MDQPARRVAYGSLNPNAGVSNLLTRSVLNKCWRSVRGFVQHVCSTGLNWERMHMTPIVLFLDLLLMPPAAAEQLPANVRWKGSLSVSGPLILWPGPRWS